MKNWILIATLALVPTQVLASNDIDPLLWGCSEIKDNDKRLACFDAYVKQKAQQPSKPAAQPEPLVLNSNGDAAQPKTQTQTQAKAEQPATQEFGLEHKKKVDEEVSEISTSIVKATKQAHSNWLLTLANGQKWRTIEATSTLFKVDQDVIIKRGMFNSFSLKKSGSNRSVKVKRIQ